MLAEWRATVSVAFNCIGRHPVSGSQNPRWVTPPLLTDPSCTVLSSRARSGEGLCNLVLRFGRSRAISRTCESEGTTLPSANVTATITKVAFDGSSPATTLTSSGEPSRRTSVENVPDFALNSFACNATLAVGAAASDSCELSATSSAMETRENSRTVGTFTPMLRIKWMLTLPEKSTFRRYENVLKSLNLIASVQKQ